MSIVWLFWGNWKVINGFGVSLGIFEVNWLDGLGWRGIR